jgi:hypothetical protein
MSVESSVPSGPRNTDVSSSAPLHIKSEHVKNFRTSDVVEEGGCGPVFADRDVGTTGAVTSAHVGHRVCVNGTKVGQDIVGVTAACEPAFCRCIPSSFWRLRYCLPNKTEVDIVTQPKARVTYMNMVTWWARAFGSVTISSLVLLGRAALSGEPVL